MMLYALVWESYAILVRVQNIQEAPGAPLSARSLGAPAWLTWEGLAVLPTVLMGGIAADRASAGGAFLFRDDRLDAGTAAALGIALLIWVRRHPAASRSSNRLLMWLGVTLLLTAAWIIR
jgi:hypothetical protein